LSDQKCSKRKRSHDGTAPVENGCSTGNVPDESARRTELPQTKTAARPEMSQTQ
ncbi:hypothetical protein LSAT2_001042, partial [Lamellibrachia satsuma]